MEAYAQGAQSNVTMQILNAEDDSVLFTGEATAMTAWGDWHTPKVTFTLDKTKSVKLRVCVEHEDGGWGAVDVLYLHKDASSSEGKDDTNTSGSSSLVAHPPAALQPSLHLMIQRRMTSQSRQPNQRT